MRISENNKKNKVDFIELDAGDCFRDGDGDICMKTDVEQDMVNLVNGTVYSNQCGNMVTPLNAEVQIID